MAAAGALAVGAIPCLANRPDEVDIPGVETEVGTPLGVVGPARPPSRLSLPESVPWPPEPGVLPKGDLPLPGDGLSGVSIVGPWPHAWAPPRTATPTTAAIRMAARNRVFILTSLVFGPSPHPVGEPSTSPTVSSVRPRVLN